VAWHLVGKRGVKADLWGMRRSWDQFQLVGIDTMMCRWGGHEVVDRRRRWVVSS
jgi:hypothetical protein